MTELDRDAVLAAIKECVAVVQPGEILAVRLDMENREDDIDYLAEQAKQVGDRLGISILFLPGDEFARLVPAEAKA
jgi:hypothetical protein